MRIFLSILLLIFAASWAHAQVIYTVDPTAGDGADNTFPTVAAAVESANGIDEAQEVTINVVPATYQEPTIQITRPMVLRIPDGAVERVFLQATEDTLFVIDTDTALVSMLDLVFEGTEGSQQTAIIVDNANEINVLRSSFQGFATAIEIAASTSGQVDIQQNTFQDFSSAIVLQENTTPANITILNNNFGTDDTNLLAVDNQSSGVVNAEYNYWGATEDVSTRVSSDNVDYSPFFATEEEEEEIPNEPGFQGDFSSVILGGGPQYDPDRNELDAAYNRLTSDELILQGSEVYDSLTAEKSATLVMEDTVTINNLEVDVDGGSVSVDGQLIIAESLTLRDGNVQTVGNNSSQVTLGSTVSDFFETSSSRMVGNFTTTRLLDETGVSVLGVQISNIPSNSTEDITITRVNGPNAATTVGTNVSIGANWTITTSQTLPSAIPITFFWLPNDDNDTNPSAVELWRSSDGGASWIRASDTTNASSGNVGSRSIASNPTDELSSVWTVSSENAPLPVTLTDFTTRIEEGSVQLSWSTASETNSHYFQAERSTDARNFESLGRTEAAGESQASIHYQFTDAGVLNRLSGIVYYRLKMVDFDGSFEYSPTIAVSLDGTTELLAYASRRTGEFKLFGDLPEATYAVQIIDLTGKILYATLLSTQPDVREYALPVPPLTASVYTLRCIGTQDVQIRKFRVE